MFVALWRPFRGAGCLHLSFGPSFRLGFDFETFRAVQRIAERFSIRT